MANKEALAYLLGKEQLILALYGDQKDFIETVTETVPGAVLITCPIAPEELVGRVLSAWEEGKVAVVDLAATEAPGIFKNFLAEMHLHRKATPYPYGEEYLLDTHKLIVLGHKAYHDALREYFDVVHE